MLHAARCTFHPAYNVSCDVRSRAVAKQFSGVCAWMNRAYTPSRTTTVLLKASPQRCTVQVRLCFVHHKTAADPVASEVRRRCASHRIASLLYVRFFDSVCLSRQASATDLAVWLSRLTPIAER